MSFIYYLRKLTSFTHGWLLSLRLCLFLFSFFSTCGSEFCVLLVCLCCFTEFILAVVCAWSLKGRRGCLGEEYIVFSHAKRGEELIAAEEIDLRLVWFFQRRDKVVVFERGARWGRSLLARWWWDDCLGCVDHCFFFIRMCVSVSECVFFSVDVV